MRTPNVPPFPSVTPGSLAKSFREGACANQWSVIHECRSGRAAWRHPSSTSPGRGSSPSPFPLSPFPPLSRPSQIDSVTHQQEKQAASVPSKTRAVGRVQWRGISACSRLCPGLLYPSNLPTGTLTPPGVGALFLKYIGLGGSQSTEGTTRLHQPHPHHVCRLHESNHSGDSQLRIRTSVFLHPPGPPRKSPCKPRLETCTLYISYKSPARAEPMVNAGGAGKSGTAHQACNRNDTRRSGSSTIHYYC